MYGLTLERKIYNEDMKSMMNVQSNEVYNDRLVFFVHFLF